MVSHFQEFFNEATGHCFLNMVLPISLWRPYFLLEISGIFHAISESKTHGSARKTVPQPEKGDPSQNLPSSSFVQAT